MLLAAAAEALAVVHVLLDLGGRQSRDLGQTAVPRVEPGRLACAAPTLLPHGVEELLELRLRDRCGAAGGCLLTSLPGLALQALDRSERVQFHRCRRGAGRCAAVVRRCCRPGHLAQRAHTRGHGDRVVEFAHSMDAQLRGDRRAQAAHEAVHAVVLAHRLGGGEDAPERRDIVVHRLPRALAQLVELSARGLRAVDRLEARSQRGLELRPRGGQGLSRRRLQAGPPVQRCRAQVRGGQAGSIGVGGQLVPAELLFQLAEPVVERCAGLAGVAGGRGNARQMQPRSLRRRTARCLLRLLLESLHLLLQLLLLLVERAERLLELRGVHGWFRRFGCGARAVLRVRGVGCEG